MRLFNTLNSIKTNRKEKINAFKIKGLRLFSDPLVARGHVRTVATLRPLATNGSERKLCQPT
ncbi:hypothetical protein ASD8599_02820 [Ascidiaceihabitans donghaensis]|uniref:Uncharacterized protein n=1 Tax=Ascidiaceihabitans donghaensis TaxID=1510460 RepID=A0A2R8BGI2_9RHOB|nr:hypothetical protein ASD8599_02820 [Ascidiaceihabitans donghaensis]